MSDSKLNIPKVVSNTQPARMRRTLFGYWPLCSAIEKVGLPEDLEMASASVSENADGGPFLDIRILVEPEYLLQLWECMAEECREFVGEEDS